MNDEWWILSLRWICEFSKNLEKYVSKVRIVMQVYGCDLWGQITDEWANFWTNESSQLWIRASSRLMLD